MKKKLLIVFTKNVVLGKVKTRLAKTIGNEKALLVYKKLVDITEKETLKLKNCVLHIYYSDAINEEKWKLLEKKVQQGKDLGEKMQNAFNDGFREGFKQIILIGSDLPTISSTIIQQGFAALENNDIVFGPADDGGYYLIGMKKMYPSIFNNKPWSTEKLLTITLKELTQQKIALLTQLNDIDTEADLKEHKSILDLGK